MIKIRVDNNTRKKIEDAIFKDATSNNATSLKNCLIEHVTKMKKDYPVLSGFLYENMNQSDMAEGNRINTENLKKLLTADYENMKKYIELFRHECKPERKRKWLLENIFKYNTFSSRKAIMEVIGPLNVQVCPYCNRQMVTTIVGKNVRQAHIDHYFCKDKYPYLALSVWNMIPACSYCNMKKSDKDMAGSKRILYPYSEEFGYNYMFWLDINRGYYLQVQQGESDAFTIRILNKDRNDEFTNCVNYQIDRLKLLELYNAHKGYVKKLLRQKYIYTDEFVRDLLISHPNMFDTRDDVLSLLYTNMTDSNHWNLVPMSKLTHDILYFLDE